MIAAVTASGALTLLACFLIAAVVVALVVRNEKRHAPKSPPPPAFDYASHLQVLGGGARVDDPESSQWSDRRAA